jgi:hypothetical protein
MHFLKIRESLPVDRRIFARHHTSKSPSLRYLYSIPPNLVWAVFSADFRVRERCKNKMPEREHCHRPPKNRSWWLRANLHGVRQFPHLSFRELFCRKIL